LELKLTELKALNAHFIHNHITNDVMSHDKILHPEFVCISSSGKRIGRADYLRLWATFFDPTITIYWDTRDEQISIFGETALVRATNKWVERHDGIETMGMTCYTDTYILAGAKWLCVQAQLTHLAPEYWPSDDSIVNAYVDGKKVS
jgi:hypothetical protein